MKALVYKFKFLPVLFLLFPLQLSAQSGSLYLTHFTDQEWQQGRNWSVVQDNLNNMIFANRRGIIVYSADERHRVQSPSMPYTLEKDEKTNKIYVGSKNQFGYLQRSPTGVYQYENLVSDSTGGNFTQIIVADSTVYFMGNRKIYRIHRTDQQISKEWATDDNQPFTGLFQNSENTFINVWNKGLYRLESDTLFPVVSGFWTKNDQIIFSIKYDEDNLLIGTDNNELYLFDGIKFYRYQPENHEYLKESTVIEAVNIPGNRMAIGTMAGGAVIIDKENDEIVHTINYASGLPVNEVHALATDKSNGLWISHDQGLTRAALNLPVKNFSAYPGLEGRPLKTTQIDTTLFVATTSSVYYLAKEESYQRETVTVKEEISDTERKKQQEEQEEKEEPDNFFKRIADKLFDREEEEEEETETTEEEEKQYRYKTKDITSLEAINYEFKEIDNIIGKYNQLLPFKKGLCVATNNGLFYINDQKESSPILEEYRVYHITKHSDSNRLIAATDKGIREFEYHDQSWDNHNPVPSLTSQIFSVAIEDSITIWAGGEDVIYRITEVDDTSQFYKYQIHTRYPEKYHVGIEDDSVYLLLNEGIYKYHEKNDSFRPVNKYNNEDDEYQNLTYDISQPGQIWVNNKESWSNLATRNLEHPNIKPYLNLFESIEDIFYKNNHLWITTRENIYRINLDEEIPGNKNFKAYFSAIREDGESRLQIEDFSFNEENSALEFKVAAPNYIGHNKTKYQFYIEGMMEDWSDWRTSPSIQVFTKKGSYAVKARAENIWGEVQETQTVHFNIPPPFTETIWFYGIIALAGILMIYAFIKIRERKLQRDKKILEQKVKERTKTIEDQKEEIKIQRDEIGEKKNNLELKNKEITDSIEYASRIQGALLPPVRYFHDFFSDYFILFKPRDIVSGDFYWITRKHQKVYITAADCTGHGVPGAFMSMLGISFLNEIVGNINKKNDTTAADILNKLRHMVKESLHQTSNKSRLKDGMDMALCIIDYENNKLHFAGANNPLFIFKNNGEFEEIKADRMPIGVFLHKEETPFTNHIIDIHSEDSFYMFSDGYPDQFGGPKNKKFKKRHLKELLADVYDRPMEEQYRLMDHNFKEWKGDNMQTDDVILIGFRI
ncbi:MAG: SpoIIE family protein phosphatase [Bacteroidales bacterium]